MRTQRLWCWLLCCAVLMARGEATALAASSQANHARAVAIYKEALACVEAKNYACAIDRLEAAYRIYQDREFYLTVLFNKGHAYARLERPLDALRALGDFLKLAEPGDHRRASAEQQQSAQVRVVLDIAERAGSVGGAAQALALYRQLCQVDLTLCRQADVGATQVDRALWDSIGAALAQRRSVEAEARLREYERLRCQPLPLGKSCGQIEAQRQRNLAALPCHRRPRCLRTAVVASGVAAVVAAGVVTGVVIATRPEAPSEILMSQPALRRAP